MEHSFSSPSDFLKLPDFSNCSDADLVALSQKNIEAFAELVNRHEKPLLRYIQRISSFSEEDAEDILQEVFLKAWRYLADFDPQYAFSTWVYRIAHQTTISAFRKYTSRGYDEIKSIDTEDFPDLASSFDLEKEENAKWNGKMVMQALSFLDEKFRAAVVLRFLEEKSYEEISDILKIPVGTAGTLVSRGKKELKKILETKFASFDPKNL